MTSMNMNILSSLSRNNNGYLLIKGGKYEEAIPEFKKALQMLQGCMEANQQQGADSDGDSHSQTWSEESSDAAVSQSNTLTTSIHECAKQDIRSALHCSTYLYQAPIAVNNLPVAYTDEDYTTLTYIVTFNLALACLLSGLSIDDQVLGEKRLRTARRLYELTFQMQMDPDILLLTAVLNNLSFVHKKLGNDFEAIECEKQLLSAVLFLVDQGIIDRSGQQVDGFLGNVMHLIVGDTCTASAA